MQRRCIGFKELRAIVSLSRASIDRYETDPKYMGSDPFPRRVRVSSCRVCWWLDEVLAWLERRPR